MALLAGAHAKTEVAFVVGEVEESMAGENVKAVEADSFFAVWAAVSQILFEVVLAAVAGDVLALFAFERSGRLYLLGESIDFLYHFSLCGISSSLPLSGLQPYFCLPYRL